MKKFVVIAGNIGAGKSTLVTRLADHFSWKPYYEPVTENPYLEDFYRDMRSWAYSSQLYFLSDRLSLHKSLQDYSGSVIQDRSVYEDAEIFARNLHQQGMISDRDYRVYRRIYELAVELLAKPDLVVYLKASVQTLQRQIALRARAYEAAIPDAYLQGLNELYDHWIDRWTFSPVITLDRDTLDLQDNPGDFDWALERIHEALRGDQGELFTDTPTGTDRP